MGDEDTWRRVLDIIAEYRDPIVVVSATARTTRRLLAAAEKAAVSMEEAYEISSEIRARHESLVKGFLERCDGGETDKIRERCLARIEELIEGLDHHLEAVNASKQPDAARKDAVAGIGERLSSFLFAECGRAYGLNTVFVDAAGVIKTDSDFGNASPDRAAISKNIPKVTTPVESGSIPVIGGYYGENERGKPTTLGFEGSDYTASLLGAAAGAEAIEIWTDVSGIYTCDPRVVQEAVPIPEISFREATELAYFGAKVLHPSTLKPAAENGIPVYVKNIFEPGHPGTKIHGREPADSKGAVRALTFLEDVVIITVTSPGTLMGYHFLGRVFETLEEHHITVDVVTTTEASVSIALRKPDMLGKIVSELQEFGTVSVTGQQGLVSLIGFSLNSSDEITERVFSSVNGSTLSLISFSRDKRNLNLVLPESSMIDTVRALHRSLLEQEPSV